MVNCANVSRNDLRWDILYPRQSGIWPAVLAKPGRYGTYDPGTKSVREVDPYRDDELPALRGWLTRGELVAYRPRRRATVRIVSTAGNRYVKVVRPAKAHKMERLFTDVLGASPAASVTSPQLPQLTYSHPSKGFLVLTEVAGDSLHELAPDPGSRILAAVGGAVARFHSLSTSGVRERRDSGRPDRWVEWVEGHDPSQNPEFRKELRRAASQLAPFRSSNSVLVHGDLHDKNVFVDGGQVGLIDVDSMRVGHPAEDLGNLAAHLVLRALQAGVRLPSPLEATADMLHGYRDAGGVVSAPGVVAEGAQTLLRLACIYRFRRRWSHLTPALLRECEVWQVDGRQKERDARDYDGKRSGRFCGK